MEGYLFNILSDGIEELYWSFNPIPEKQLKVAYRDFLNSDIDYDDFENYYNGIYSNKIERVYINEIYI